MRHSKRFKTEAHPVVNFIVGLFLIGLAMAAIIAFSPTKAYPQDAPPPEHLTPQAGAVVPTDTAPAPACLNCGTPVMDLKAGVATSFSPVKAGFWATLDGSVPITFGDDLTGKAKTIARGGARVHIGMETGDGSVVGQVDDESIISEPQAWQRIDAEAWLETVVGRKRYDSGHEVLTSLIVAAGGAAPLNSNAEVDPRVTTRAYGGFRVQETKSGADFVAGLGWDRALEAYREDPDGLAEGFKTLHLILRTSLPVPKTDGTTWFVGETALDPRTGNARVEVGLGFSPGEVLRKFGKKG